MPRYSVIIPVYKVEDYLSACVDSVLAQDTASDYEVILVDDGSPDRCGAICDEYAARHPHVRVIHQANAGVSAARNAGMAAAQGAYILFLDGDDLWKPQLLSAVDEFLPEQPDMVLFCYETFDENGSVSAVSPPFFPDGGDGHTYLNHVFSMDLPPFWSACLYAFRSAWLRAHQLRFPVGQLVAEDMDFTLSCLSEAQSVDAVRQVLYRYRTHASSSSFQLSAERLRQRMDTDRKWYGRYPSPLLANYYALEGLSIAGIPNASERAYLKEQYFRHGDILHRAAGKGKAAYWLLRVLGIHLGAKVFFLLVKLKQCLHR